MENALIFYKLCLIFHRCIPFLCAGGSVYPLEFWDQNSSQSASSLLPSPLWLPPLPALPQKPWSNRLGQPLQFCWWSAFRCLRGCRFYNVESSPNLIFCLCWSWSWGWNSKDLARLYIYIPERILILDFTFHSLKTLLKTHIISYWYLF